MKKEIKKKFESNINLIYINVLITLIILIISLFTSCSTDQNRISSGFPESDGYINDYTNTLSESWVKQTEQFVQDFEKETSCEIAVAVIDTLEGISIEEYADGLFSAWGIGKKAQDNGVLLLVALKDKELRIEVGYGLEGVISDLQAKRIIDNVIVPRFSSNDYESGLYNGVIAIANTIYLDQGIEQLSYTDIIKPASKRGFTESGWFVAIIAISVTLPWVLFGTIAGLLFLKRYINKHRCPKCKKIGLVIKEKILTRPTFDSSVRWEVIKYCRFCDFKERSTRTIPKSIKSAGSGGSSNDFSSPVDSSSSSDFGSSSSGSSSSGFGGGSSGGGGASGSW